MAYKKIGIANLMPGGEAWWLQQSAVNHPQRYGITEQEMEADKAGPNGEVVRLADQKNWPPQSGDTENPSATNTGRKQVDEGNVNDPQQVEQNKELIQGSDDNAAPATTSSPSGKPTDHAQAVRQSAPSVGGYDDILALMKANALSEGDMARRQHSREIVTGLGDLVSSIANMWATTKGAPNAYDNAKGMTATSQSLYDRELARRKAQNENILNYYRVKKAAEDDADNREYRRQMIAIREQEANRRQAESDAKIKREDDVAQARANLYKAQEDKANADTVKKKGENQYAVTYWKSYSQYRLTMDHEEADRLANIDAAAAEQDVLNAEQQRKETESTAKVNKLNRTGGNKGGNKSNKPTSKKKKKQSSLYGSKKKLY